MVEINDVGSWQHGLVAWWCSSEESQVMAVTEQSCGSAMWWHGTALWSEVVWEYQYIATRLKKLPARAADCTVLELDGCLAFVAIL